MKHDPARPGKLAKYLSGYRPPSMSSKPSQYTAETVCKARTQAYTMWLLGREAPFVGGRTGTDTLKHQREWIDENMTPEVRMRLARQFKIQAENERRAFQACERAGELLAWRGFGAYVEYGTAYGRNDAGAGAWVWSDTPLPYVGRCPSYYTDGIRFVYIGTVRARGHIAQQRKPIQLIIEVGRLPDDGEIEQMLDELLDVDEPELMLDD